MLVKMINLIFKSSDLASLSDWLAWHWQCIAGQSDNWPWSDDCSTRSFSANPDQLDLIQESHDQA